MPLISWRNNLSVQIPEIDGQHQQMIRMINDLHAAMGSGKGREVLGTILSGLVEYTKGHFAAEERLLEKYSYPGYLNHKAQHHAFTKWVIDVMNRFRQGETIVTAEVMRYLKDWLIHHIQTTDRRYAPYLKYKGSRTR